MATSVVMPALEMAQETGKLVSWLKQEGETVEKGDMLLEVETDKAVVEIEAQADGVLGGVTAKVGDVVPVGQTIAWLLEPGESGTERGSVRGGRPAAPGRKMDAAPAAAAARRGPPLRAASAGGARISPKARKARAGARRGRQQGQRVGPGRRDCRRRRPESSRRAAAISSDRCAHSARAPRPSGDPLRRELRSIAGMMAERTTQSWTTVPHFFLISRRGRDRAQRGTREGRPRRSAVAWCQAHAYGFAGRGRRARAAHAIRG